MGGLTRCLQDLLLCCDRVLDLAQMMVGVASRKVIVRASGESARGGPVLCKEVGAYAWRFVMRGAPNVIELYIPRAILLLPYFPEPPELILWTPNDLWTPSPRTVRR